jgi:hypothetical protein
MGSSTECDIVKNVACVGDIKEISNQLLDPGPPFKLNGWDFTDTGNPVKVGRRWRLYVEIQAIKGNNSVYLINTSEYSAGGDFEFAIFSENKASVVAFLNDFNLPPYIADEDGITQTL